MKTWTVIAVPFGVIKDEVYAEHIEAESAADAMQIYAAGDYPPGTIIGAIEGAHQVVTPMDLDLHRCAGCGREEADCSANPCEAVIADREEEDEDDA